jgi:hypothetical protein
MKGPKVDMICGSIIMTQRDGDTDQGISSP